MMMYLLEWWRFVMILLKTLCQSYIKIVLKQVSILMHGESSTLSQFTRKERSKLLTITDQSPFFLFLVKFSRKSYLIRFLNTFKRIVFFVITNQVFNLLIHVSINYFLLLNLPKDVRGIFRDILKAFDRLWHEGLICKMKCIGITGMPANCCKTFFKTGSSEYC